MLPARTILVAAGTQPNTVLAREDPDNIALDGRYFQALDEDGNPVKPERVAKPAAVQVLMSHLRPDGRAISFFGDLHPSFAGNVVKAMGGAKQGYPVVSRMLARRAPSAPAPAELMARLNDELRAARPRGHPADADHRRGRRARADRRARLQARPVLPAAELRDARAAQVDGTTLAMEGLALTGAGIDREQGLLSTDRARDGRLVRSLRAAEAGRAGGPDGPDRHADRDARPARPCCWSAAGSATRCCSRSARRLRARGLARALFRRLQEDRRTATRSRRSRTPPTASSGAATRRRAFTPGRPQDRAFVGNIVEAMAAYGRGELGDRGSRSSAVDRIIAIGSDGMMNAVAEARHAGAQARISSPTTTRSARSTRRCSA